MFEPEIVSTDAFTDLAFDLLSKFGLMIIPVSATALAGIKSLTILNTVLSKNLINLT